MVVASSPALRAQVELRLAGAPGGTLRQMVRPELLPVFLMFFFWGFGTGGLWLVRPLFAFETGGTFLAVAMISSVSAMPRLITGPVTCVLTDRFGRKPFVLIGSVLHITAMVGDFYVDTYLPFLLLENIRVEINISFLFHQILSNL